jgi:hypothetical protein
MTENVTDHGAAGDGSTADTEAIRAAADAAGPDGTFYFPAGTYLVGSNSRYPLRYPMDGSWDNLTWRGEDHGTTTLKMAGSQGGWHMMFRTDSDGSYQIQNITFEQLTFDMNSGAQSTDYGSHWCDIEYGAGTLVMRDCVVQNTLNAGVILEDEMAADIKYCHFRKCGDPAASAGHAINPNQSARVTTDVAYSLIEDSAGTDVDVGDGTSSDYQTVNIHRCYINSGRGAVKLSAGNLKTTVTNSVFSAGSRTTIQVKANNSNEHCGSLELNNVAIAYAQS